MKKFYPALVLLILSSFSMSFAQKAEEIENTLKIMRASTESDRRMEADRLNSLVRDIKTTLYVQNGVLTQEGEGRPERIITDVSSLNLLSVNNPLFAQVELICIKLESTSDLNIIVNNPDAAVFKELKYVYFLCTFEACPSDLAEGNCLVDKVSKIISVSENPGLKIFYKYSINK